MSVKINRREALKYILGTGGFLALMSKVPIIFAGKDKGKETLKFKKVDVPPSLMLHSTHSKLENLEPLLDILKENGYKAVTYIDWLESVDSGNPIEKPILISCDDLTLVKGVNNIVSFRRMKDAFVARGMKATFAVITEPVMQKQDGTFETLTEQDQEKWNEMLEWIGQGMEIATHTSHHTTLNGLNSLPRGDFDDENYTEEVTKSAELIEYMLFIRGLTYKVKSLITPFGSGYSYSQDNQDIHPGVKKVCEDAGIKLVIGIAGGRTPVDSKGLKDTDKTVTYVGRIQPKEKSDGSGLDPNGTLGWINQWQNTNESN